MAALGLGYLPTGKRSRPGSQRLSVMIQIRNWKPPWQACVLAKFLPIWLSLICGQESWLPFWLITLQHHGICSYTARSRVLYRSGCDWCTTTLSRLSQTPSYFPRAWGHSLNTCQQSSAFGRLRPDSADSKRSASRYWRLFPAFRYVNLSAELLLPTRKRCLQNLQNLVS